MLFLAKTGDEQGDDRGGVSAAEIASFKGGRRVLDDFADNAGNEHMVNDVEKQNITLQIRPIQVAAKRPRPKP